MVGPIIDVTITKIRRSIKNIFANYNKKIHITEKVYYSEMKKRLSYFSWFITENNFKSNQLRNKFQSKRSINYEMKR